MSSTMIHGVGRDAARVVGAIEARRTKRGIDLASRPKNAE
jgi:hypothetical protein